METEKSNPPSVEKTATPAAPIPPTAKPVRRRRRLLMVVGLVVALLLLFFGIPWLIRAFNTVSTDDAYVNGYATFVAPRIGGQVARVLVDETIG
jgi:membrane fusion protein, multidrug efflux system